MTKKDYKLIANVLAKHTEEMVSKFAVVRDLAMALRKDNPNFDASKFFYTCYTGRTLPLSLRP